MHHMEPMTVNSLSTMPCLKMAQEYKCTYYITYSVHAILLNGIPLVGRRWHC